MQFNTIRKWGAVLALLATLNACQQPTEPGPMVDPTVPIPVAAKARLKTMIRSGTNFYNEYSYAYNTAGQLISYTLRTGKESTAPSQTTRVTYDQQGRVSTAERLAASSFTNARLTYEYTSNGQLSKISSYEDVNRDGQYPLTQTISFTYNADKLPVQTVVTSGSRTETTKYTYDQGNIIKSERLVSSPSGQSSETIAYRHDTSPNPMYGLLMTTPTVEVFNKNNVVYDGCEMTYSHGLLATLRADPKLAPGEQWQVTYTYEKN